MRRIVALTIGGLLLVRGLRRRSLRGLATAAVGGALLYRSLKAGTGGQTKEADSLAVSRSVTVGKPADEVYDAWRDPDVFTRTMGGFAEVTPLGNDRYRWTVSGPRGRAFSWETRIVEDEPGEFLAWETAADSTVQSVGSVRFRPVSDDRGTVVTLTLTVDPPGGAVGQAVLKRLGLVPETLAGRALGRFKSLVESGEIPTTRGNPSGRGTGDLL